MNAPQIARLMLSDFRTYPSLSLDITRQMVVLTGENGVGKTNILEALSLFVPGRGLRRAEFAEMARQGAGLVKPFAVSLVLSGSDGEARLGTGGIPTEDGSGRMQRLCRIDGVTVSSPASFADYIRPVWLTPDQDGLFRGSAGERRRFLDRLVLTVDAGHGSRVNALERALRARNRLLEEHPSQHLWLDAAEREIAELAIAVAAARQETVSRLATAIQESRDDSSPFPYAEIVLSGEIDDLVALMPAIDAEDRYRTLLHGNRQRDRAAGRTLIGPQASDLSVRHGPKGIPAESASTGEQKALLIGLILAHARLVRTMSGLAPLVLLDEIAAHLDPRRRAALFEALETLGGQVWMTGADRTTFEDLRGRADLFDITPGTVVPLP